MIQAIRNLSNIFPWRKTQGGVTKQASDAPSKTFSDENAENQSIQHEFPLGWSGRTKYGGLRKLAQEMQIGDFVVCPNRSQAESLRASMRKMLGNKCAKTSKQPDGSVKVWRQS